METIIYDKECRPYLDKIVDAVYNPYRVYHFHPNVPPFRNLLIMEDEAIPIPDDQIMSKFQQLLSSLESMNGGNSADTVWFSFLQYLPRIYQYWFALIVNKNAKDLCGWHKWKKYGFQIPEFKVQLATLYNGKQLYNRSYIAETKYDGIRAIVMFKNGIWQILSRNGKPINNTRQAFY